MQPIQSGILEPVPPLARYLTFTLAPDAAPAPVLQALADVVDGVQVVAGVGAALVQRLGGEVPGLGVFPGHIVGGVEVPSTPRALMLWLRASDRGELVQVTRRLQRLLAPALRAAEVIDAFCYDCGRDLSGYEDGTENPEGEAALEAAVVRGQGPGLDGSSFLAVQQWLHDLDHFDALGQATRDAIIGRRLSDNEELEDAPSSAHVKRTAQEDFEPPAFVLRRSMPWADGERAGLVFAAFGASFGPFEALLRRMLGRDDGVQDALFRFTRPLTGSYFWCPPLRPGGGLDLRALGLPG